LVPWVVEPLNYYKKTLLKLNVAPAVKFKLPMLAHAVLVQILELEGIKQSADLLDIVRQPDVDVVVEVMGGIHPAYEVIMEAIKHGKQVVTANKALLQNMAMSCLKLAEDNAVQIAYEAAVAGGIPLLKSFVKV
jgi:homoserine dehydrogenase